MPEQKKEKIAILGGGVGSISTAFYLSDPSQKDKYDITVYQMGWRLGGKGASGRNMDPAMHYRIEEHGVHVWSGLYDNAFRSMRKAYEELNRPPDAPLGTWREAFKPKNFLAVAEEFNGKWYPWIFETPTNDQLPGEDDAHLFLPFWSYLNEIMVMFYSWFKSAVRAHSKARNTMLSTVASLLFSIILDLIGLSLLAIHTVGRFLHRILARILPHFKRPFSGGLFRWPLRAGLLLLGWILKRHWGRIRNHLDNVETRRRWIELNFMYGNLRGLFKDRILSRGFHTVDNLDYKEWLAPFVIDDTVNGKALTMDSPFTRFLYSADFAYENGDLDRPNLSASIALYTLFRMAVTWKGALIWEMQAGMGDTVFAPFYEVLKRRGVKFEFFHKIKQLHLSEDGKSVGSMTVHRQAKLKDEYDEYEPLVTIKGLPCWPSTPLYDQLKDGEQLKGVDFESWCDEASHEKILLKKGEHFDRIVLGISIGSLPYICCELIEANERWKKMVDRVESVRTQACQLWLKPTSYSLGWHSMGRPLLSTFDIHDQGTCADLGLSDTWADMSHLLDREGWPARGDEYPLSIAYFCGPMRDDPLPADTPCGPKQDCQTLSQDAANAFAKKSAQCTLDNYMGSFWPDSVSENGKSFNYDLLVDDRPGQHRGIERFDAQYFRGNVQPSERYVLSLKGSTPFRLKPGDSGFTNLVLAGDWTDNGFNAGSVEAATMSGQLASNAICGFPELKTIVGLTFGHFDEKRFG